MQEIEEGQVVSLDNSTMAIMNRSEIDQQIATAHKYPRSVKRFRDEALALVTLNESVAEGCIYSLPRGDKTIEGPSARFAEVIASAWGNSRAGTRVVSDTGDFVTAQGVFHDLERNVAITYEVQRRIVDSRGTRYKPDMIGVTANAACSIALRNAILKGVPKAFWEDMYQAARKVVMGDFQTLANKRGVVISNFQSYGILPAQIFAVLGVAGMEDISLPHLVTLRGLLTAIRDGDTTPEQAFAVQAPAAVKMPERKERVATPLTGAASTPETVAVAASEHPQQSADMTTGEIKSESLAMQLSVVIESPMVDAAEVGEVAYITAKAARLDVAALSSVLHEAGFDVQGDSKEFLASLLRRLTKDGFNALREALKGK